MFSVSSIHAARRHRNRLVSSRLRRSRLITEVNLRRLHTTHNDKNQALIQAQLLPEDVDFFREIFNQIDYENLGIMLRSELHDALMLLGISASDQELDEYLQIADADGSNAIDMQEWLALCGTLVKPPYDEQKLQASFELLFQNEEEIPVATFRFKMQRILENAYRHLPECNPHEVSCFVDDMVSTLDPHESECIDVRECMRLLGTPYNSNMPKPSSLIQAEAADASPPPLHQDCT